MARRTKEDADATRNALLDAAELVFYEKGVARASLSEIAQTAGATRGAIYWHFKDKVDLFNAMMDRATLPLERVCNAGEAAHAREPLAQLRGMVELLLRSIVSDVHMRRVFEIALYRVEYVSELSGVRERHLAAHARFQALLERNLSLAAAQASLALPMPAAMAAAGLHALFNGLLQSWLLGEASFDLPATGRAAVDAYLRGLGFHV
ncbi:TetR family transcriptional regulator [Alicycliphilus denitrificans]|uniref:TetR family transcriptional regulator n=1 Tax=Alicycliphilus denitrificans TaxID=179636 RepID=UPI003A809253